MKKFFALVLAMGFFNLSYTQIKIADKKYPSIFWEITGIGISKPSYLIGTMHVSNKLAFHLSDSFYLALRSVKMVALETNPETWQDDMNKYVLASDKISTGKIFTPLPEDYLHESTLKIIPYEASVATALYSNPAVVNNLLYRSYGDESSDFEEDTYLDMYIYQCGKKWGKKVGGVEDYAESMHLMSEAYKDALKDENKKDKSYDASEDYSTTKLQEAYRSGDLDLLDSINRYNSVSVAFDEKFIYKRNEIQAHSIDSIIKSGTSLFVGVGAAHLPGERGVIEILRKKGYKLRPIKMGERNSQYKSILEKIYVPLSFKTSFADDSLFKVDVPGNLYKTNTDAALASDERQYSDMANGSYYLVTRIPTNAWMWSEGVGDVIKKVDSMLYENIPGKILSKKSISRDNVKGIDILNKTRRGDIQRYNIFTTPFEVIIFRMSGIGAYVQNALEGKSFFNSIHFFEKENKSVVGLSEWKKFTPKFGGFSLDMPGTPFVSNDGSWVFDAEDKSTNTNYRVRRTDINNFNFASEDSFDLDLMNESFTSSEFIDTQYFEKKFIYKRYPALDVKFKSKTQGTILTRFIIQGPHYYTLIAKGKQESKQMTEFLNSFEIKSFVYDTFKTQVDTSFYFSVKTLSVPSVGKVQIGDQMDESDLYGENDDANNEEQLKTGIYRSKIVSNDSTGEKIYVTFDKIPKYFFAKDTAGFFKENEFAVIDSSWTYKTKKKYFSPNGYEVWESKASEPGSSRLIWTKSFYKNGYSYTISTQTDSLTKPSAFVQNYFETFTPSDKLEVLNPFTKKSDLYFKDLMGNDSLAREQAHYYSANIVLDSTDLPQLKNAINTLNWKQKNYLDKKKTLINKLSDIKTNASANFLKKLFYAVNDTATLQNCILENLLRQKTAYAYSVFKNIIVVDPPVLNSNINSTTSDANNYLNHKNGSFIDYLYDSLRLTKAILPDLLPLLNLDDYNENMMNLLSNMLDSGLIKPSDYEQYFNKFLLEAKQMLKKQKNAELNMAINKAEANKSTKKATDNYYGESEGEAGNDLLELYAKLIIPFANDKVSAMPLIQQILLSDDKKLKYNTFMLLLRNGKSISDTLSHYFAQSNDYRYKLYVDLRNINRLDIFPASFNNHIDLAKSRLTFEQSYSKPDTVAFVDTLPITFKNIGGLIYFFKYKAKKDDALWKLASVGMIPTHSNNFLYDFDIDKSGKKSELKLPVDSFVYALSLLDFTAYLEQTIDEDEPIAKQLQKALKKLLYSRSKSGENFYEDDNSQYANY